uniref:Movement protein n=2 Tax=Blackberry chlorotic ringspot virus TaxID=339420 RepID=K0E1X3_9BROM|nr:movement protein [Blackberry chlorotic ringspot virus]AFT91195.1 movement protein [Blackberry chlorotic ringspot virus]AFT91201.1 movement protein [Blackberry chlorotic ringspot virus]AGX83790.1 movement protein [Blackberry chlorotic ringspot virus]
MALTPKMTALTFSADDEASLEKAVTEALAGSMELNMGIRRCAAFPATNTEAFLCELTTKETKTFIGKFTDKVRGRVFVDHAVIHLMYIPVILNTTDAIAELKIKNLATGDELYGGTKVNLNEAFILTMTWPRSLFADEVNKHKGLYLGGVVSCAPHVPKSAKIGMWYPMWTEKVSAKQLYQDTAKITNTRALETYTRTMISSDKEMRSLLRSRASIDIAAKSKENPVLCSQYVNLLDQRVEGVDFTVKQIKPADVESLQLDEGPSSETVVLKPQLVSTDTTTVDVDKPAIPASRNLLTA